MGRGGMLLHNQAVKPVKGLTVLIRSVVCVSLLHSNDALPFAPELIVIR